jgi:hypothetical protein
MKTLHPSSTHSLREVIGESNVVGFNVGPSGEVYLVLALEPLDYRTEDNGFATFPKTVPASPKRYRILALREGGIELDVVVDREQFNIHDIQPLADHLLLACSRSEYRGPNDFDLNGRVYSRDGMFIRGFLLGDGLEAIQATRRGELWASYFDEGIFGNFGWRDPVGAAGLVAWNEWGEKQYDFEAIGGLDSISDCYALNVATDEDVWCYYYTEFPLVHLHNKRIAATWNVPVTGSHAFAVAAGHALFAGSYKDRDTLQLIRLKPSSKATQVAQFELLGADNAPVKSERTIGRGESLYVLSNGILYEIALGDVLAKHAR